MSTLMLDGRPPDLVFQKRTTLTTRATTCVSAPAGDVHSKEVWVCAATHDIGIDFSEQTTPLYIRWTRKSIASGRRW